MLSIYLLSANAHIHRQTNTHCIREAIQRTALLQNEHIFFSLYFCKETPNLLSLHFVTLRQRCVHSIRVASIGAQCERKKCRITFIVIAPRIHAALSRTFDKLTASSIVFSVIFSLSLSFSLFLSLSLLSFGVGDITTQIYKYMVVARVLYYLHRQSLFLLCSTVYFCMRLQLFALRFKFRVCVYTLGYRYGRRGELVLKFNSQVFPVLDGIQVSSVGVCSVRF